MTDRDRLGPPPVEPMSDIAWSRVERGLWTRVDAGEAGPASSAASSARRSAARWWIIAAPLAAAAILAIVVGLRLIVPVGPGDEPVRFVSPAAQASSAPSAVSFEDSHIELDPDTALVTSREGGHPHVLLERGGAWFTVAPRRSRPALVVRAGDATVRVVGTRFRVARSDERIAVAVDHGAVDVQFRGMVIAVPAGHQWSSESPARASVLATVQPPAPAVASRPEPASEPGSESEPESEPEIEMDAEDASPAKRISPKRTPRPAARPDAAGAATPEPPQGGAPAADIDRERAEYERLAALEPKAPDAAQRGYMALAKGTSRWAGLALYAAARLAADRHDKRAETLLGIYLQRFPSGANAEDARRLLSRLKADPSR
jgi:hypothetical protein